MNHCTKAGLKQLHLSEIRVPTKRILVFMKTSYVEPLCRLHAVCSQVSYGYAYKLQPQGGAFEMLGVSKARTKQALSIDNLHACPDVKRMFAGYPYIVFGVPARKISKRPG